MNRGSIVGVCIALTAVGCSAHINFGGAGLDESPLQTITSELLQLTLQTNKRLFLPDERMASLMVSLQAQGLPAAATDRGGVAMALVLDASGSMAGNKMEQVKAAAHDLVDQLQVGDIITVISYANAASVHLANYRLSSDRSEAHRAIEAIQPTGSTCVSCGMELAFGLLSDAAAPLRRVVLLSDGNANRGVTDANTLYTFTSNALDWGIPMSTIGVGTDYNEDLMTLLANAGAGQYYFVADGESVRRVIERELVNLSRAIANNVILELVPENGAQLDLSSIPGSVWDGQSWRINLGQVPVGSARELLIPVQLPAGDLGEIASASVYFDDGDRSDSLETMAVVARSSDYQAVAASANPRVVVQEQRIQTAVEVERALAEWRSGQQQAARDRLAAQARTLDTQVYSLGGYGTGGGVLADEAEDLETLEEMLEDADDERLEVLERHNRARSIEMQSMPASDMYYEDMWD